MLSHKIIQRVQKLIDKENKPKSDQEKETAKGKLYKTAGYIEGDTYLASPALAFIFHQTDYGKSVNEMPEEFSKKIKGLFEGNPEIKVEIPALEFYKYFEVLAKICKTVKVRIEKNKMIATPYEFKKTIGSDAFLSFEYNYDFGFDFQFAVDPQIMKDALIPAFASKQEKVLLKLGNSLLIPIRIEGGGYEAVFAPKRSPNTKK